jgi:hypothetical protein
LIFFRASTIEITTPITIKNENEQQEDSLSNIENISQVFIFIKIYLIKFFISSSQYQIYNIMDLFIQLYPVKIIQVITLSFFLCEMSMALLPSWRGG